MDIQTVLPSLPPSLPYQMSSPALALTRGSIAAALRFSSSLPLNLS